MHFIEDTHLLYSTLTSIRKILNIICCQYEFTLPPLALQSQNQFNQCTATQLSELPNQQEIKGAITPLWSFGALGEVMKEMQDAHAYALCLHCVETDGAHWKGSVKECVRQACLYLQVGSLYSFCFLLSIHLQHDCCCSSCSAQCHSRCL